jgi:phage terminase large subunit-like protein
MALSKDLKKRLEEWKQRSLEIRNATLETAISESEEEKQERIRRLLIPGNYGKFISYYFGQDTADPLVDAPSARFHVESYMQLQAHSWITQFRPWYRGAAKSIHSVVGNPLALMARKETKFILVVGANEDRAKILLSDLQLQLENNQRYIADFGPQKSYGDWSEGAFETQDGVYCLAVGLNQPIRGLRRGPNRPDLVIIDDIEDREVALNPDLVRKRGEKITGDIMKSFGKKWKRMVVANNFITKTGVMAYLMDKLERLETTKIHQVNFIDKNGKPTWPERYTEEDVQMELINTPYFEFQRELMNNPIEEGRLFRSEWIKYKVAGYIKKWDGFIIYMDPSYTKKGDYKAGAGLGFKDGKIYCVEAFCRKCEITELVNWYFNTVEKLFKKGISPMSYFDGTASQDAVHMPVFRQAAKDRQFPILPMADKSARIDKHARIEATLTNALFNGLLVFDQRLQDDPDLNTGMNQLLGFEKGTRGHDDFPDVLEAGVRIGQRLFSVSGQREGSGRILLSKHKRGGF